MYPFKYSFSLTYNSISSLLTPEMRRRVKCQPFERERARVDLINLLPCNRFQSVVPYLVRIIKQLWIMIAHKIYPRKSDDQRTSDDGGNKDISTSLCHRRRPRGEEGFQLNLSHFLTKMTCLFVSFPPGSTGERSVRWKNNPERAR